MSLIELIHHINAALDQREQNGRKITNPVALAFAKAVNR